MPALSSQVARIAMLALAVVSSVAITACGSASSDADSKDNAAQQRAALAEYRAFLRAEADALVKWTGQLDSRVRANELEQAQSRYASSRVPFGHLRPIAMLHPALDRRMDASVTSSPAGKGTGFHELERVLWVDGTLAGAKLASARLRDDAEALRGTVEPFDLDPARLATGIDRSLDEILNSSVLGKEQPHSHIDLVDASATVEGAEAAYWALEPILHANGNADLAREIRARFRDAYKELSNFGFPIRATFQPRPSSPGTSFVLYIERSDAEHQKLAERIAELAEPLSRLPAVLPAESAEG